MEIRPILAALMRSKTGAVLIAVQVAISLAILSNALHIVNQRLAVAARPSGVADEGAMFHLAVRALQAGGHNAEIAAQKQEAATLRAVPGVLAVARVSQTPLSQAGNTRGLAAAPGQSKASAQASVYVTADPLVAAWGLKLVEGRDFLPAEVREIDPADADAEADAGAVVVTRALAEQLFPGQSGYVGRSVYFGIEARAPGGRIVGVVERLQSHGAQLGPRGETSLLRPARGSGEGGSLYSVRAAPGQRDAVMRAAEEALRAASPSPLILKLATLEQDRAERYRNDTALAWMLTAVCVLLLLVTASGVVGMASLWVTQRRRQIGIRRALGARRRDIVRYFLLENLMITSAGVAGGVLLALALNQLLVSRLEMARLPYAYLLAGAAIFWPLGLGAAFGPARRAAAIAPASASRGA